MIVDIVPLPRRLKNVNRSKEAITSETVASMPMPAIRREFGYWEPDDSSFVLFGGVHHVITGRDTPFRYKFIEPTKYGLAEYFVLTTAPIDVLQPWKSKGVQLICPWVVLEDLKTMTIRKFIVWNGIFELTHFETEDNVRDVPAEGVIVHELRTLAKENGRDDFLEALTEYPADYTKLLISEEKLGRGATIDDLLQLGSNIAAYESMIRNENPCFWCDIGSVVKGVNMPGKWNNFRELIGCSFLNHVLYGKTSLGSVRHLFGLTYDAHVFQRPFIVKDIEPYVELSIEDNSPIDMFGVLKYIERIPYSEFVIELDVCGSSSIAVFNPHDPIVKLDVQLPPSVAEAMTEIRKNLSDSEHFQHVTIRRSWSEEVYITIKMPNGEEQHKYFDLVSASLGSRTLIRDYDECLFC